jgi:hypothetical protein
MAHGKQGPDGSWRYPNEINWRTDAERVGDGGGITTSLQATWAAWRYTGDAKYLRPIEARLAKAGPSALAEFSENAFDALPGGAEARRKLAEKRSDDPFSRYTAWAATGDTAPLEALHADAIADKSQHMDMYTEGHWWSDRVDQPSDILQRERLGGVALRRNQSWPGNTVSWRFAEPGAAERVAILLPGATPTRFRVIAYNTTDHAQRATMSTWTVAAGRWSMRASSSTDGGKTLAPIGAAQTMTLERSAATDVSFAPGTTVLDFALVEAATPVDHRADLGIGTDDILMKGRNVAVTVHSLGAKEVKGGRVELVDATGKLVVTTSIPPLAAPRDLQPKTITVKLAVPASIDPATLTVHVALTGNEPEITQTNNRVPLQ